jgi:hypothetical protein
MLVDPEEVLAKHGLLRLQGRTGIGRRNAELLGADQGEVHPFHRDEPGEIVIADDGASGSFEITSGRTIASAG